MYGALHPVLTWPALTSTRRDLRAQELATPCAGEETCFKKGSNRGQGARPWCSSPGPGQALFSAVVSGASERWPPMQCWPPMIRVPTGNLRYAGELCASVVSALGGALLLADLPGGINLVRAMSRSLQPVSSPVRLRRGGKGGKFSVRMLAAGSWIARRVQVLGGSVSPWRAIGTRGYVPQTPAHPQACSLLHGPASAWRGTLVRGKCPLHACFCKPRCACVVYAA